MRTYQSNTPRGTRKQNMKSFCGLLGLAFIVLKLTGVSAWSWLWVTAPLWGGLAIVVLILLAALVWVTAKTYTAGK